MRTIEFNNEDIKECKLALLRQNLTSLQSAFLMQHITNLEQALNEIKEYINNNSNHYCTDDGNVGFSIEEEKEETFCNDILKIIDTVLGEEKC